jgi:hypothetical protein
VEGVSMSDDRTDRIPWSFFDLYSYGKESAEAIDDWVGRWHDGRDPGAVGRELHEYLGLSLPEYQVWVYDADALPYLLDARRAGRSLDEVVGERLAAMVSSSRPTDRTIIRGLEAWLNMRALANPTAA